MPSAAAVLVLADGSVYQGVSIGATGERVGELVFNTSMTGYQEILTDPSYAKQIITFTVPHIGNVGCNQDDMESNRAFASGLVVREISETASNYRAEHTLPEWLKKQGMVGIANLDTRQLTLKLQKYGAINACISTKVDDIERLKGLVQAFPGIKGMDLAKTVTRQTIERWHVGQNEWRLTSRPLQYHIVAYDFGVKHSILRILHDLGCHITLVPAKTSATEVLEMKPDGVFLSNGPGDPMACQYAVEATQALLKTDIPIFGICLGFQILALACGARALKMKFGHHGANHPVIETQNQQRVFITSQNHSFAIDEKTLPDCFRVTHRSRFDGSLQGIRHRDKAAFGFQGHPEANPGPHDIHSVFLDFIEDMKKFSR